MKAVLLFSLVLVIGVVLIAFSWPGGFDASSTAATSGNDPTRLADPASVPDPTTDGSELPRGYRLAFPRDAIAPVYDPEFVQANDIDWTDDSLVIGLEIDGQSKAYPVSFLNRREMVIDRLAGIPILVTW